MKTRILLTFLVASFFMVYFGMKKVISFQDIQTISSTTLMGNEVVSIDDIIYQTLSETTSKLTFKLKSDSYKVSKTLEGNCVGYTMFYNDMLVNKLRDKGYGNITVSHVRAKVHVMGVNIHMVDYKPLIDHDVTMVKNNTTNETYIIDASLSEVFDDIVIKR